jgi:hypothetical protein
VTKPHSKGAFGASSPSQADHSIAFSNELTSSTGAAVFTSLEPHEAIKTVSNPYEIRDLVALRDFLMGYLFNRDVLPP